jgi:hypothetical protein
MGITTEEKWSARVEGWRSSGLTARAFCEGKEFTASGLRHWASRLGRVEPRRRERAQVRVARVVRPVAQPAVEREVDTPIVLELAGARVGLRRGFDRDALVTVLDVLADRGAAR